MRGITRGGAVAAVQTEHHIDCSSKQRRIVLMVAVLGSALGFIDGSITAIIAPAIRVDLGSSLTEISWVVNGYTLVLTSFILLGGAAGDAYGKRRIFAAGIAIFALASLVCAVAPTSIFLIAARLIQGFGAALMVPLSLALIATYYPKEDRGRAVGIWAAASAASAAIGPLIGGVMVDTLGWRSTFYINLPLAAVTLWLLLQRVPDDSHQCQVKQLDFLGAGLATIGLGGLALGLTLLGEAVSRGEEALSTAVAAVAFLIGALSLVAFIFVEARTANPMMPLGLFRLPGFAAINLATFMLYGALGGLLFFLPVTLIGGHGLSSAAVATVFLPFTLVMAALTPRIGGLVDRLGVRWPLAAGSLIAGVSFYLTNWAVAAGSLILVGGTMVILGIGMSLCIPPLSTAVLNAVDDDRSGIASGINNAVSRAGGLFAVAIFAPLGGLFYGLMRAYTSLDLPGFASVAPEQSTAELIGFHRDASVDAYGALALTASALAILTAFLVVFSVKDPPPPEQTMEPSTR